MPSTPMGIQFRQIPNALSHSLVILDPEKLFLLKTDSLVLIIHLRTLIASYLEAILGCGLRMERGVKRWIVDISKWDPSPQDFSFGLSALPLIEHSSICRYVKMEDRKRALVSRLLQYALVHEALGIPCDEITIKRTLEGKPYLECGKVCPEFPNFNFNTSHHGDYVAIASEPLCLVGLDIISHINFKETVLEFIHNFSGYFSSFEWENIITASSCDDDILNEFYRYWCLKEACVKAMGSGVTYGLEKLEFHHRKWKNIYVKIDGKTMQEWKFWIFELGKGHLVSVAKGHPRSATLSYKKTLKQIEFSEEEYHEGLYLPCAGFTSRTVEQLIQDLCTGSYSIPRTRTCSSIQAVEMDDEQLPT